MEFVRETNEILVFRADGVEFALDKKTENADKIALYFKACTYDPAIFTQLLNRALDISTTTSTVSESPSCPTLSNISTPPPTLPISSPLNL